MKPIIFDNVSKSYRRRGRRPTLAEIGGKWIRALKGQRASGNARIDALKEISFEVAKGEILGIIGPNGAGKTTILSLIAGVTRPTRGEISVQGRIAPLIALGAGFHPELTGRENIYLNSVIMGMNKKEVQKRFDAIVDFAELGEFLNTPVKRYSSGMHARLGFATAIHIDPDILLVDEVLAVGDFGFQQKCFSHIDQLKQKGVTIILVSHNLTQIGQSCDRVILLNDGNIITEGNPSDVINKYYDIYTSSRITQMTNKGEKLATIKKVELLDINGNQTTEFKSGSLARCRITAYFNQQLNDIIFNFSIHTLSQIQVMAVPSNNIGVEPQEYKKGETVQIEFQYNVHLLHGAYKITLSIRNSAIRERYDFIDNAVTFYVHEDYSHGGIADINPHCTAIFRKDT